ncbi:hypothetical protein MTR_2g038570 [Medicago truncatula]|uniref:Uncharacterized protein n=1 Tax=Medicago truncatula TaxID=3880 RepID=G7IID9_MEDTR|nr:hypothetical protein MTR_2g038570 [Medicago truncatula]
MTTTIPPPPHEINNNIAPKSNSKCDSYLSRTQIFFGDAEPKITAIQEAKGLNNLGMETLINYLKSHEIYTLEDDPSRKGKSIALKSNGKTTKALQVL